MIRHVPYWITLFPIIFINFREIPTIFYSKLFFLSWKLFLNVFYLSEFLQFWESFKTSKFWSSSKRGKNKKITILNIKNTLFPGSLRILKPKTQNSRKKKKEKRTYKNKKNNPPFLHISAFYQPCYLSNMVCKNILFNKQSFDAYSKTQ